MRGQLEHLFTRVHFNGRRLWDLTAVLQVGPFVESVEIELHSCENEQAPLRKVAALLICATGLIFVLFPCKGQQ